MIHPIRTATVGGRDFVGGLIWQVCSDKAHYVTQARKYAKDLKGMDLVVYLLATKTQAGFAKTNGRVKEGVLSLAAAIVKSFMENRDGEISGDVLAIFELPGKLYSLTVLRGGAIEPDGDVIGTAEEISTLAYQAHQRFASWNHVIAPDEFGIAGARHLEITDVLPSKGRGVRFHKWWRLKPVQRKLPINQMARLTMLAGAVMGLAFAAKKWKEHRAEQELEIAQQEAAAQADAQKQTQPQAKPWDGRAETAVVIDVCRNAIDQAHLHPAGWSLETAVCDASAGILSARFKREGGLASWIAEEIPQITIKDDGDHAEYAIPLPVHATGKSVQLLPRNEFFQRFWENAQRLNLKALVKPDTPAVTPLPGSTGNTTAAPSWLAYSFSIDKTAIQNTEWLGRIDGVFIDRLVFDGSDLSLPVQIEGKFYAK